MTRFARLLPLPLLAALALTGCSTAGSGRVATPTAAAVASSASAGPSGASTSDAPSATTSGASTGAVTSDQGGFSIIPPPGWNVANDQVPDVPGLDLVLLSSERIGSFNANLVVITSDGDQSTADAELAKGRRQLGGQGVLSELPPKQVGGETAEGFSTAFEQQGVKVVARSFALHHEGKVYLLTLSSSQDGSEAAMAQFDQVISTWTWT